MRFYYSTIIDTPIAELADDPTDDFSGIEPSTLIDLIFINTEIRFIPPNYFDNSIFGILEYM